MGRLLVLSSGFWKDNSINPSGAILQTYYAARFAAERGWEVDYVTFTRDGDRWLRVLEQDGMRVHYLKPRRPDIAALPGLLKYASRIPFQVVYQRGRSWLTFAAGLLARRKRARFVWASSAQEGLERSKMIRKLWKSRRSPLRKFILSPLFLIEDALMRRGISMADVIVVQNEYQASRARELWGRRPVVIIPNMQPGVEGYPAKRRPVKVVWVGTLTPWKRPEVFLEIARRLGEGFQYYMAGGGDASLISGHERIPGFRYLGRISSDEVNELLEGAWFIVNTSVGEGIPNAVIQGAMRGAVPISMNEDYGFLPPSLVVKSVEGVVELIRRLSSDVDEYRKLSMELFEKARRVFGYRVNGEKLMKVFSGEIP